VARQERLPHPNPHRCVDPDCGNRATLRLTLVTGDEVTACRPHASAYPTAATPAAPSPPADAHRPVNTTKEAPPQSALARFRPGGQHDLAPSGEVERIRANLDAVRALARQQPQHRPATAEEQVLYARWSGWGATPALFDERPKYVERFAAERAELRALLGEDGYRAARATTLNAHYTDAAYVGVIWQAMARFGFAGGTVLEPGCGSGNFLGFAPPGARLVGVEVDPTTALIAQALYPDAEIRAESFADTRLPEPGFDLVIGNVPFGSHKLHDPRYNPGREHSIHNHFIVKSLHATRPGGLVALITSRFTMDGVDAAHQRARQQMAGLADLLGAVRLPGAAHQVAAGTEVVTDLLVFRRHADGHTDDATPQWLRTRRVELPAGRDAVTADTFDVNEYFLDHPQMVLGEQLTDSGRNGTVLAVRASGADTAEELRAALDRLVPAPQVVLRAPEPQLQEGLFIDEGNGRFSQIRDGRPVRHEPAKTQIAELRALIGLRETVLALLDEEANHRDDTLQMAALRAQLNTRYDAYVAKFGAINRFQRSTGTRTDKDTGAVVETERRTYPRMGGFRDDPFFPYVAALEKFDDDTQRAGKAEVFTQRVIAVPNPVQRAATADDALVVCWDRYNEVRLDVIAALLGLDTPQQARDVLGDLVYEEPGTGTLRRRAEYLSGNVRAKLTAAEQAAATDPRFDANVRALRAVVPRDLTPAEISARLGSPWIAASYVQQFLRDILEDNSITVTSIGARWSVSGGDKKGVLATTVWGTKARTATDLADNLLNSQTIEITKTVGSGKDKRTVRDTEATAFAQAKAQQLDARFRAWLWEDPDRATILGRTYNDRFNARVPRSYEGEHVEAPGLSAAFRLHPHQMAAVARIRNTPGVGLFHGTGAGKTLEMIVGGMELVRLGLVTKPCYVVPKGVLGQFRREFLQAYPRAKVLAADSEDLRGDQRRQFVARCSTGNWDAIIISHNAFKKIPVSRAVRVEYLNKQLDRLRTHLANAEGADRYTVKDIEKQVANLQEQIAEQLATPSDPGVEFERTGIGYLFVDEAHVYKNLRVISSIPELAHPGNQITADLDMKLEYLRRSGRRVVTLATATPIDNSPSEILTMTKYAAPELLTEMGVEEDDQYHAAFIQPRRRVEMRPDGNGFESRTRYSRYVNLTEQKQLMYSWADVKLKEHLDLGEPAIIGGQPEVLAVPASAKLHDHLVTLAARAMGVKGGSPQLRLTTKGELKDDNILWISTDGRTASLDLRLIGDHTDEPQKIDVAADRLVEIWREHRNDVYYRPDGTPEPLRGSLQLVFCDLGVPRRDRWSAYEGLRDELVARGMPADQIRFAQNATSRRQKDQLDQDARDGKIAVLVGSRQGLGTGRNIQRRVITVLQLDPTWKLTPVTQSLGRGQRQGNDNEAIHHIFVVTENSYDPFLWQKVDDKARFTRQMLDPNDTTRIIDAQDQDDDGGKIDPAVMFAVAAGRPELLELHKIEETVGALRLEARIWGDEQFTLTATVKQNQRTIAGLRRDIADLDEILTRRRDTRGDAFRMTLDGTTFDSRADAGTALVRRLHAAVHADQGRDHLQLGELGGISLSAGIEPGLLGDRALLRLDGIPDSMIELTQRDLDTLAARGSAEQVGLIRKLENRLAGANDLRQRYLDSIDLLQANIDRANARIGLPFPQQADLDRYTDQLVNLQKQLETIDAASPHHTADRAAATTTPGAADRGTHQPGAGAPTGEGRADAATTSGSPPSTGAADQRGTPTHRAGAGNAPPELWIVTEAADDGPRTTLATAQLVHQQLQAGSRQRGWSIDADGERTTVRDHDGNVAYTIAPSDLPWRSWQASEADHIDLGPGLVWHLRLTPDGRFASTLGGPGDARRILRQAQADGSLVAVTDWGVVAVHQHRPVAFIRQAAAIPDLPEVPAATAERTAPDAATPAVAAATATTVQDVICNAGLPTDQQRWLIEHLQRLAGDPHLQMVATANDYDHARLVLDEQLDVLFAEAVDASDIDGIDLTTRYFDRPSFRSAFRDIASAELYRQARAATDPGNPAEGQAHQDQRDDTSEVEPRSPNTSPPASDQPPLDQPPARPRAEPTPTSPSAPTTTVALDQPMKDGAPPATPPSTPVQQPAPTTPVLADLTPSQRAAMDELGNDRGEPWSIRREWRIRTFAQLSADELAGLPADGRDTLIADVRQSLTSPAWRERATARRLLDRWSDHPTALTAAQEQAVDALCVPPSGHGRPDSGRLALYGRLTAEEYLTLDPGYRDDIKADLNAIADSGATKTIPRNRSGIGATVRAPADHVNAARSLLQHLGSGLQIPAFRSNATNVGNAVVGLALNPGDQVQLGRQQVTVDRVGIDHDVHLVGGGTLPDSTRRYRLIAAGAEPDPSAEPTTPTATDAPAHEPAPQPTETAAANATAASDTPIAESADRGPDDQHGRAQHIEVDPVQLAIELPPGTTAPTSNRAIAAPTPTPTGQGDTGVSSAEQRLLNKVAARIPDDVVHWPSTPDEHPTVLLAYVANGTYGSVSGVDLQRQPITAQGYVIEAQGLRGGYGGWHPGTIMVVELGDLPDGPAVHTVQTDMDARLTVLDPPRPDMPPGEAAPWLRMPVEEQILAARTALGLTVEVRDGPANELWTVQGCPEQLTGEVAWWLFGGKYHSWVGRARPVFHPRRVQEAITGGRIAAEPQTALPTSPGETVEARIARLRPYTEPGPQFRRAVAEAVSFANLKIAAGLDPTGDLLEGEVSAGLRSRTDLAAWRSGTARPTAPGHDRPTVDTPPAWLAGVVIGEETPTADGRHQVQRRANSRGSSVYVEAMHPQVGMLPRGRIVLASRGGDSDPTPTWQLVNHDGTLIGEYTGTYHDAETALLAATAYLDDPPTEQEAAETATDPDPQPDHGSNTDDRPATPRTPAPVTPHDPDTADPDEATTAPPTAETTPAAVDTPTSTPPTTPPWSERIQIIDGPKPLIRGTTGAPNENGLRGLLKQYRFWYHRVSGEWRYSGRPEDRTAAIADIRRWLAAQDRAATAKPSTPALPPTEQQQRIIDAYLAGHTIAVQALAGTGKTSTLGMLAAARPQARVAYIAFQRTIADEAQRKFPRNVRADTSHAFAREALVNTPLRHKLDRVGKGAQWPEEWVEHLNIAVGGAQAPPPETIARMVMGTVRNFRESAADAVGRQHLPASVPTDIPELADAVLNYARAAWQDIADPDGKLRFDHDDYIKLWALGHPRLPCDVIFFDEAQDINPVLSKVIQDQPMQTIVVGDSNQSIYGFRGAIDALKNWPAQTTLPLTQSWRFGTAVADVGNRFLRMLSSPLLLAGNPTLDSSVGLVDDPDAILARTNAGAVTCVFDAFDQGKRVALMGGGRAIEDIAKAAKDLQAGRGTKHPDLSRFTDWDEVRDYVEDGEDAQSLRAFVRLVDRRGADGLLQMVRDLVGENETDPDGNPAYDIIVATVHKAKGREWAQVRIADDFPQPHEDRKTGEIKLPDAEQLRLAYVAVTRGRHGLELGSLSWIQEFGDQSEPAQALGRAMTLGPPTAPQSPTAAATPDAGSADASPAAPGVESPSIAQALTSMSDARDADRARRPVEKPPTRARSVPVDEAPTRSDDAADHSRTSRIAASTSSSEAESRDQWAGVRGDVESWLSSQLAVTGTLVDHRARLARCVADLADDNRLRNATLANDEESFGRVFEPALEDHLAAACNADVDNPALLLYFRNDDFAGAFNAYATHVVYRAVYDRPAPVDTDKSTAIPEPPVPPRTDSIEGPIVHVQSGSDRPTAPQTAAELARLDSAAETPYGKVSMGQRAAQPVAQPASVRRAPGL
jgi:N12 class adenine-specific DNA methylase